MIVLILILHIILTIWWILFPIDSIYLLSNKKLYNITKIINIIISFVSLLCQIILIIVLGNGSMIIIAADLIVCGAIILLMEIISRKIHMKELEKILKLVDCEKDLDIKDIHKKSRY